MVHYWFDNGRVRAEPDGIRHLVNHGDAHVFEVELVAKYAEASGTADVSGIVVMCMPTERTLHLDESADPNYVGYFTVEVVNPENWHVLSEITKHTLYVAAYRRR